MWRKEDGRPQNQNEISTVPAVNPAPTPVPQTSNASSAANSKSTPSPSAPAAVSQNAVACLSQGIRIKGEITGGEDLFIDGNVEGKVNFQNSVLTVGPNATVKADINAREIVVRGRVLGKLDGRERVQIWSTAHIQGDIRADRVSIEEGAEVRGSMEAGKAPTRAVEPASSKKTDAVKSTATDSEAGKASSGAAAAGAN